MPPPLAAQPPPPPWPLDVHDLITEILSWLPVKSLMQLKCVCKSWRSIISDPTFAKLHLHRTNKNNTIMLTLGPGWPLDAQPSSYFCPISSLIENPSSTIDSPEMGCFLLKRRQCVLGSCNGVICLGRFLHDTVNQFSEYRFRLWNPVLNFRSEKSPCIRINMKGDEINPFHFGFGYDELTDTYKVVTLLCNRNAIEDSQSTKVKVFSFGNSCWRDIQNFPAFPFIGRNSGKFLGGSLNWLAVRNMRDTYKWKNVTPDQLLIVSLDMQSETYKQFRVPIGIDEFPRVSPALGVYRGCLYLFHDNKDTDFVVWQMKEFGDENSWTQFIRVGYQNLQVWFDLEICNPFSELVPVCISENGDILMLGNRDSSRGLLYDRRDSSVVFTRIPHFRNYMVANGYYQSLILPC